MPAQTRRRSRRGGGTAACEAAAVSSPVKDAEEESQGGTDRRVTRGRGRAKSERKRGVIRASDVNTGPKCPIFLLSHELLTLIWTFLDSRTKMTTTVSVQKVIYDSSAVPKLTCVCGL